MGQVRQRQEAGEVPGMGGRRGQTNDDPSLRFATKAFAVSCPSSARRWLTDIVDIRVVEFGT
jgi:hypothetical protein